MKLLIKLIKVREKREKKEAAAETKVKSLLCEEVSRRCSELSNFFNPWKEKKKNVLKPIHFHFERSWSQWRSPPWGSGARSRRIRHHQNRTRSWTSPRKRRRKTKAWGGFFRLWLLDYWGTWVPPPTSSTIATRSSITGSPFISFSTKLASRHGNTGSVLFCSSSSFFLLGFSFGEMMGQGRREKVLIFIIFGVCLGKQFS